MAPLVSYLPAHAAERSRRPKPACGGGGTERLLTVAMEHGCRGDAEVVSQALGPGGLAGLEMEPLGQGKGPFASENGDRLASILMDRDFWGGLELRIDASAAGKDA